MGGEVTGPREEPPTEPPTGPGQPGELEPEERPPRLQLVILVLFPFALVVVIALLYMWLTR